MYNAKDGTVSLIEQLSAIYEEKFTDKIKIGGKFSPFFASIAVLFVLLLVAATAVASEANRDVLTHLNSLADAPTNLNTLATMFKMRQQATPSSVGDVLAEFVAVALLKAQRPDLYTSQIMPHLNRRSLVDSLCKETCTACSGTGYLTPRCTTCNGSGRCNLCRGQGIRTISSFDGRTQSVNCAKCRQTGRCDACAGEGFRKEPCRRCGQTGGEWSVEKINRAYRDYVVVLRAELLRADVMKSIVIVKGESSVGSGFLVKLDGRRFVASNAHVLIGNEEVILTTLDGRNIPVGSILMARDRDIALFEVTSSHEVPHLDIIDDPEALRHGQIIYVYGNSQGAEVATCLIGMIEGVGPKLVETDAEFVAGNSGSPMLLDGKVAGIATFAQMFNQSWVTEGTRFTKVRRFATRIDNLRLDSFQTVAMNQYREQVKHLNRAKNEVENVISRIDKGQLGSLGEADINRLKSVTTELRGIIEWASFMMKEEADKYILIAEAIVKALSELDEQRKRQEELGREAAGRSKDMNVVINALMLEQAKGKYGLQYWYDSSIATRLFAPVSWDVLESNVSGTTATALVRVESSTQGGIPIRKLWTFYLRYTASGWKVALISEN